MEQQLINALLCLIDKMGGESFIQSTQEEGRDRRTRTWTKEEIEKAFHHVEWVNTLFAQSDAAVVINKLVERYGIDARDLSLQQPL